MKAKTKAEIEAYIAETFTGAMRSSPAANLETFRLAQMQSEELTLSEIRRLKHNATIGHKSPALLAAEAWLLKVGKHLLEPNC